MSYTQVETQTIPIPHYVMPLKHTALSYLQAMSASPLFSDEEHQLIQDLIANLKELGIPCALVLFLSEILYPAVERQEEESLLIQLLQVEDHTKSYLAAALPKGTDVEAFIKESRSKTDQDQEALHDESINALFQIKIEQLYKLADKILLQMDDGHENLKQKILKIIQLHEKMSTVDTSQVARIDQLTQELLSISLEFQRLGEKSQENYKTYQQLLGKCHELFKRV